MDKQPPALLCQAESLFELAARINAEHEAGERSSLKGIQHFRTAGLALIKAKEKCGHGKWLKWLEKNVHFSQPQAWRYMELAKLSVTNNLEDAWRVLLGNEEKEMAHVGLSTGQHEWYTPPEFLHAAHSVLGGIDLDPASSNTAQKLVNAKHYFTKDDDGLSKDWKGRVWLNPPYASGVIDKFAEKLARHFLDGDVIAAIFLSNNATETEWYANVSRPASAVCFPFGRISYLDANAEPANAPLQGQSLLYLGTSPTLFCKVFKPLGRCWKD